METRDDAGYVPFGGGLLLQSVDFFTPIVDDPYRFGQIAAANALSDIYAMGGVPLTAMNLVAFPCSLDLGILREILAGGRSKIEESEARLCGGHSIQDDEPKYGLSVTGFVEVDKVVRNEGAQVGDALVLTKPSTAVGASPLRACSRSPGANFDAQPALVEYFVSLMRVRSSIGS